MQVVVEAIEKLEREKAEHHSFIKHSDSFACDLLFLHFLFTFATFSLEYFTAREDYRCLVWLHTSSSWERGFSLHDCITSTKWWFSSITNERYNRSSTKSCAFLLLLPLSSLFISSLISCLQMIFVSNKFPSQFVTSNKASQHSSFGRKLWPFYIFTSFVSSSFLNQRHKTRSDKKGKRRKEVYFISLKWPLVKVWGAHCGLS